VDSQLCPTLEGPTRAPKLINLPGHRRSCRLSDVLLTTDLARWGWWGIPSAWQSPTTRQAGGSPRRNRRVCRPALSPAWRVVALRGGRGDAPPCPPSPAAAVLVAGPSRRSARPARAWFWLDPAALADVARLGECQPGLPRSGRQAARENVGWGWSMLGSVGWRELYPICTGSCSVTGNGPWRLVPILCATDRQILSEGSSTAV
jgi:hypothetical protein